jgi:hypothetical protein
MHRKLIAFILVWFIPAAAMAGPLKDAAEKGGREMSQAQAVQNEGRHRGRMWTGIGLLAGGALMTTLGTVEIGDDETGPDDGEDLDESDDGEDSDGVNKALVGGGIAAAALGGVLLFMGRDSGPRVSLRKHGFVLKQTVRF